MGSFVLRKARPRKDGRVTLTFSGYVNGKRVYHGTGIAVKPEDWDEARQQVRRGDVLYAQINAQLREYEARFEREVASLVQPATKDVERLRKELSRKRENVDTDSPAPKELTFWSGYDAFVRSKSTERGERTIAKYRTLSQILKEFEAGFGKLSFESMTLDFYDAFKKHLLQRRKLTNNTVGKYVSTLKTYLSWADDRGVEIPKDFRKFKVDEEDVEVIALTWDEVQRMQEVDLTNHPRLDRVRDLFLFACFTGARYGDVQNLHLDDIRESSWYLRMGKTKSETRIHLIPQALAIVNKYRVLGHMPKISSQRMNDYLKELGQFAEIVEPVRIVRFQGSKRIEERGPKWQFLSSHVARKTFVTISLDRGMRPEIVMSITGHRSFKTMKKYIALTEQARSVAMESVWTCQNEGTAK